MTADGPGGRERSRQNLRPAQKGEVRNPKGNNVPEEIRELRNFTNYDVEKKLHKLLRLNHRELQAVLKDESTNNLERLVGAVLFKAIMEADVQRANFILERTGCRLPPMVQPISLSLTVESLRTMPQGELIEIGAEALRVLRESDDGAA